jgi:predicted nucleotidyltransferase
MNIVEQNIATVTALCQQHHVRTMYLFGSVLTDNFSPSSDVDFMVNFGQVSLPLYFDNYMALKDGLEHALRRPVDLLEEKTIRNPILRRSIDRNKQLIYG